VAPYYQNLVPFNEWLLHWCLIITGVFWISASPTSAFITTISSSASAMGHQKHLFRILGYITLMIACASAITCYWCTDEPYWIHAPYYDENCANYDYHNGDEDHRDEDDTLGSTCAIGIFGDGYVEKFLYNGHNASDGDCSVIPGIYTACYCSEDFCNTGNLCEHCFTSTTPEPSTPPTEHLQCYQCEDCPEVNESTPVQEDTRFNSCVTKVHLVNDEVLRVGSSEEYPDGQCIEDTYYLTCWCNSDLCNNKTYPMKSN